MIESLNDTAGARVNHRILLVVSVNDSHLGSLEGHSESKSNIVFSLFDSWSRNTVSFDCKWQTSPAINNRLWLKKDLSGPKVFLQGSSLDDYVEVSITVI